LVTKNTKNNMKKIIVTGITGQDGSFMADFLVKDPNNMVYGARRRLSSPNYKNISHLLSLPNFKLIELDVTDSENVNSVIRELQPDYYINLAANSFVGNSWTMPINHMQTNTMGVLYALEAIKNFSPKTIFYNAGSSEQFGDVQYSPQDLKHPFKPRSPYGASKCAAHHLVKVYRESYNLYAVQGILFNHEGTRRGEEFVTRKITKGVARIKKAIDKNQTFDPIELGNIYSKRDWSDAEDFVEGIWLMLNQSVPKDYILSSGETHTIKEFIEAAFNCAGIEGNWIGSDLNEQYIIPNYVLECNQIKSPILVKINQKYYRPAEVDLLLGDFQEAKNEIGWEPKTSFEELVRKMVESDLND
jgi:GDPmannose 4,6-dehydratase